jgi:O-antigen ligase
MLAIVAMFIAVAPEHAVRAINVVADVRSWLDGTNLNTPPGHRLSIWRLSLELVAARPLAGYGWQGVAAALASPAFSAAASPEIVHILVHGGPHNDLLMMTLSHGVFGVGAYAALLFVPAAFFWRQRAAAAGEARLACELGLCLCIGVFVCGLSNELLSLKYLVSFYSLTVAGLAAQVLGARPAPGDNR